MSGFVHNTFNHVSYIEVQRIQIWAVWKREFFGLKYVEVIQQKKIEQNF